MENRGRGVHFTVVMPTVTNTEMAAGFGSIRGFKNAEPEDVARAVAGVIAKPKPRVFVPRSIGIAFAAQRILPLRIADAMGRMLGADRVCTSDLDVEKHAAYDRRAGLI
jgi:short-subunit dehydrogenase